MRASDRNDGDLLREMSGGDEQAFTTLYRAYQGPVYRFALQMSGKAEVAEEVTQDVFLWLMGESRQYDPERGSLLSYLYGVARNHVMRHLQRHRGFDSSIDDPECEAWDRAASGDDVLSALTRGEQIESLRKAILKLPAPYREVVVLCELHELDYTETAQILGCPVGTVRSRLHRARTLLQWKLRASERCAV